MIEFRKADEVVDQQVFGDLWAHVMDNYETEEELMKAYLGARAVCAVLENILNIPHIDVHMEDEE